MSESSDSSLVLPTARRRRAASIAYLIVAILIGIAIAREYVRVKRGKTAAALDLHSAGADVTV